MLSGRVHLFGDSIDTDVMIPARYLTSRDPAFLGLHCMEALDPGFPGRVRVGDVIVAGRNFGCGSSREHAILALQGAGIACIIAASFARIFYRNAINQGLPILICPEAAAAIADGASVEIDLSSGRIECEGQTFQADPLPEFLREIMAAGGIVGFVRQRLVSISSENATKV